MSSWLEDGRDRSLITFKKNLFYSFEFFVVNFVKNLGFMAFLPYIDLCGSYMI